MVDLSTPVPEDFTVGVGRHGVAAGMEPAVGIVHVDQDTQVRTPKASAHWLRGLQGRRRR